MVARKTTKKTTRGKRYRAMQDPVVQWFEYFFGFAIAATALAILILVLFTEILP